MGREAKVLPTDVLNILEREGQITRTIIARELECSSGTVSRKVRRLIKDGENIGFDKEGLFIQHPEDIKNPANVDRARAWTDRVFNTLIMWAHRGNNQKKVAIEARKRFAGELTYEERKTLKSHLLLIGRVVDAINLDEELQE